MKVQVTRGAAVQSIQQAFNLGLHLPNGFDNQTFPGLFFYANSTEENAPSSTAAAERFARSQVSEGNVGAVVAIDITRENFEILQGRIFTFREYKGQSYPIPVSTFDLLEQEHNGLALINLVGIGEKRLEALNIKVGFNGGDGIFTYTSYKDYYRSFRESQAVAIHYRL